MPLDNELDLVVHLKLRLIELRRPGGVFDNRDTEIKLIEDYLAQLEAEGADVADPVIDETLVEPPQTEAVTCTDPGGCEDCPDPEVCLKERVNAGVTSEVHEVFAGEAEPVGEVAVEPEAEVAPEAAPEPVEAPVVVEAPKPAAKSRAKRTTKPKASE